MAKQLKGGYLLRYKKKLFWKGEWKEEWIVLYETSNLVWYKNRDNPTPSGGILISDSPELLAVGLWTLRIPNRPMDLPNGYHTRQLIAIGTKGAEKVHWFLCKSEDEINEWMTAISNTLPAPPARGQNKISYSAMNKSFDDVIRTPNHLRNKDSITHKSSSDFKFTNPNLERTLPKQSSSASISSAASSTVSKNPSMNKVKNSTLRHYNSSGQLHSTNPDKMDTVASTLAVGTALGVWSHGFGWGWGPGWGANGWGSTSLSLSHPDFSSTIFRAQDYLPTTANYGDYGSSSSHYHHNYTNTTAAGDLFDSYGLDSGMGTGDDLSSAFDAFGGGDFGF